MICTYCPDFALGDTTPPLCAVHLDLDCLIDFARSRKEEITIETIQKHFRMASKSSNVWVITEAQIAEMLPSFLEAQKRPATPTTEIAGQLITTPTKE